MLMLSQIWGIDAPSLTPVMDCELVIGWKERIDLRLANLAGLDSDLRKGDALRGWDDFGWCLVGGWGLMSWGGVDRFGLEGCAKREIVPGIFLNCISFF
jgi:hypothetical protein